MIQVFPDRLWGSDTSPLRRPLTAFACSGPGSWAIRKLAPVDRRILHSSGGKYTMLGPIGAPTMLLIRVYSIYRGRTDRDIRVFRLTAS